MFLIIGETAQNVPQDKYERKEMKKNVSWWSFIRFQSLRQQQLQLWERQHTGQLRQQQHAQQR